ncbi:MAG: DEAD/DEAH box helicase [Kangiellaceae bacterium]|nr:DEAD/DEAH box helicase [Kangiellaceae bacterium]
MQAQKVFDLLDERLRKGLTKLTFETPTEIQQTTIPLTLGGQDLMASAETGSGKSAAFLLPILHRFITKQAPQSGTRALILAPTRELARQLVKHIKELAQFTQIQCDVITGGDDYKYQRAVFRKNPEIIVATPGRMLEHCQQNSVALDELEFLVLDEADKMLELGFSDDVLSIAKFCSSKRQTLLFSATLHGKGIKQIAQSLLTKPISIHLNHHQDIQNNIQQQIITADDLKHKENLTSWLLSHENYRKAIVFCNTKAQVDRLGGLLRYHNHAAGTLHGDNTQEVRNLVMSQFRDNKFKVLAASDVAARGIDVKDIDLVINFDMAQNADDYIHRIGRTGRAGETGLAISLVSSREWNLMASIERFMDTQFEKRVIKSLLGKYQGPKNLKSNGKAASNKKRKDGKKLSARDKKRLEKKQNKKIAAKKPIKKFGASELAPGETRDVGFTPMKKKKAN